MAETTVTRTFVLIEELAPRPSRPGLVLAFHGHRPLLNCFRFIGSTPETARTDGEERPRQAVFGLDQQLQFWDQFQARGITERNMPDPKSFRENAERCLAMTADTPNPDLRESLVETTQRRRRLATEIEADNSLFEHPGLIRSPRI